MYFVRSVYFEDGKILLVESGLYLKDVPTKWELHDSWKIFTGIRCGKMDADTESHGDISTPTKMCRKNTKKIAKVFGGGGNI
jgi:hypothetical protein